MDPHYCNIRIKIDGEQLIAVIHAPCGGVSSAWKNGSQVEVDLWAHVVDECGYVCKCNIEDLT